MREKDHRRRQTGPHAQDGAAAQCAAAPRVFVVSDMRLYRDFLVRELVLNGAVELVGATPAAEAAAQVLALRPDVLLLDTEASGARHLPMGLKAYLSDLRIIACGVSGRGEERLAWLKAGVAECLGEDCSIEKVATAVHRVWRDEIVCPPSLLGLLSGAGVGPAFGQDAVAIRADRLTARERQVLSLVAADLPSSEIARQLGLHPGTIRNHVHRILQKLGSPDRR